MLLLALAAHAVSYGDWLHDVDAVVDQNTRALQSCVTFARAVEPDTRNIAVLELQVDAAGRFTVRAKNQTMIETWITSCMAKALGGVKWPDAPGPATVGITVEIRGVTVDHKYPSFFEVPRPSEASRVAALNQDMILLAFNKGVEIGRDCLKVKVADQNGDTSGRIDAIYTVNEDGGLHRLESHGAESLGAMRECVLHEFDSVHVPAGYPDTPPITVSVEFHGEGGAWAASDASVPGHARAYSWHYTYWVGSTSDSAQAKAEKPEPAFDRWLYRLDRGLSGSSRDFAGCLVAEDARSGDYEALLVSGTQGLESVAVRTRSGPPAVAACLARAIAHLGNTAAASRWIVSTRIEFFPGDVTIIHGPEPVGETLDGWPSEAITAAIAGDADAFGRALGSDMARVDSAWSAGLSASPPAAGWTSWASGGRWPSWDRLMRGTGDPVAAERLVMQLQTQLGGCFSSGGTSNDVSVVVALAVAEDGTVSVGDSVHNAMGSERYDCLKRTLDGQRGVPVGGSFIAIWPFTLGRSAGN